MSNNDKIIEFIIKGADGLPKIEKLMTLTNLPKYNFSEVENNVFKIRHRIIHGGFFPTHAQASIALALTQSVLKDYNIDHFD